MTGCSQCGECCRWFVVSQKRGLTPWQVAYLRERCDRETDQYFLLDAPCKHLKRTANLKSDFRDQEIANGEYYCDMYNTRPQICRDYQGKRYSNGQIYYVPESCNLSAKDKDGEKKKEVR